MSWHLAEALKKLRSQVDAKWPDRSKDSDGSIGDVSHSARESDHNPDSHGIVHAIDITHDPAHGFDSYAFADLLLEKQDARLKYVISNRRIGSGPDGPRPGDWRPYHGINPHDHHVHISVEADGADDVTAWDIDGTSNAPVTNSSYTPPPPTMRFGSSGPQVQTLQGRLNAHGANLAVDGSFGGDTEKALRQFQTKHGLVADGVCGPQSWKALLK